MESRNWFRKSLQHCTQQILVRKPPIFSMWAQLKTEEIQMENRNINGKPRIFEIRWKRKDYYVLLLFSHLITGYLSMSQDQTFPLRLIIVIIILCYESNLHYAASLHAAVPHRLSPYLWSAMWKQKKGIFLSCFLFGFWACRGKSCVLSPTERDVHGR
jgi:hypothetical protein